MRPVVPDEPLERREELGSSILERSLDGGALETREARPSLFGKAHK